jgi:hypothetical protein
LLKLIDFGDPLTFRGDEFIAEVDVLLKICDLLFGCVQSREHLSPSIQILLGILQVRQLFDVLLRVAESYDGLGEVLFDFLRLLLEFIFLLELLCQELWVDHLSGVGLFQGVLRRTLGLLGLDNRSIRVFAIISVLHLLKYLLSQSFLIVEHQELHIVQFSFAV